MALSQGKSGVVNDKAQELSTRRNSELVLPRTRLCFRFSNRTLAEFFEDHFDINIYADAFSEKGTSKFNRLLAFIELSPPHLVIELLNLLWKRLRSDRDDELEQMAYQSARDEFTVDLELVRARHDSAKQEDEPFVKIISELGTLPSHTAVPHLERMNAAWNLDTVDREYRRAIDNVEKDPEAAVTAACSMIENLPLNTEG